jgi:3-oxoacyl-[acyl-carrier protein] reductase
MELNLAGRRAAVGGMGFAIARALAKEGCRVAVCSRSRERIEAAAASIRKETGAEVIASAADLAQPGATAAWLDDIAAQWGGLDLVVPNSGGPAPGRFADGKPEDWDAAYHQTLRPALEAALFARRHMGRGSAMLFLTGPVARQPAPMLVLSGVMRGGVSFLAKALSDEWAPDGIRVNHLIPGRILTDRVTQLEEATARRRNITVEETRAADEAAIPLHRSGTPEELAAAAVFLLSDAASYITGATLQVDGGMVRAIV